MAGTPDKAPITMPSSIANADVSFDIPPPSPPAIGADAPCAIRLCPPSAARRAMCNLSHTLNSLVIRLPRYSSGIPLYRVPPYVGARIAPLACFGNGKHGKRDGKHVERADC